MRAPPHVVRFVDALSGRRRRRRRLIAIEDGLRVLHSAAERGGRATVDQLAGSLGIKRDRANDLVRELADRGLVRVGEAVELTESGESAAETIVRAHRIWERYLADELGTDATELHRLADKREHDLGVHEVDELAARLGYPLHDPHGDPIPPLATESAAEPWVPLSLLETGASAEIVHIEDEPETVFARIAALGLEVGQTVTLKSADKGRLTTQVDGATVAIDGTDAASVAVVPRLGPSSRTRTLADLGPGEEARIVSLRTSGFARRRLLDLGFTPGARIACVFASPFGSPTAYRVRSTLVALRPEQARRIEIEPDTKDE